MSAALRAAEEGIAAAGAELRSGVSEKTLTGAVLEAMAVAGVSTPATQDGAWVTSREHPWQRASGDGTVRCGDLVALSAGALADGYVGEVARTWPVGEVVSASVDELYQRAEALWGRLFDVCRPGAVVSDFFAAYESAGEPLPPMPVAHGLGLGFDPPVVSPVLADTTAAERVDAGMVLAVTGYVWQDGVGTILHRDTVHITDHGPKVLTTSPSWHRNCAR